MVADDDLVCPPPVPACDHPARRVGLRPIDAQLSRRRGFTRGARSGCLLRNGATMGLEVRPSIRPRTRRRRPRPTSRWHLDEMALMIAGRQFWLWRAVDDEGELDLLVQRRRDKAAAVKLMRKLLKKQGFAPDVLVADKLRSYGAARRSWDCRLVTSRACARTIAPRIRINQHGGGSARCSASNRRDQPSAFYPFTPPSKTLSTSNAISPLAVASASFATRRSRHGELRRLHDPSWDFRT
jgi:DDE domain